MTLGKPIVLPSRYVDLADLKHGFISFSGKRMRVASRGVEKAGVDPMKADLAERRYREENGIIDEERVNFPDGIYRNVRERPLFILHYVKATPPKGKENLEEVNLIPQAPVVAWE